MDLTFPLDRAAALLASPEWSQMAKLRGLFPPEVTTLGYCSRAEHAFLACDQKGVRRFLVALQPARILVTYDFLSEPGPHRWLAEPVEGATESRVRAAGQELLNVVRFGEAPAPEPMTNLDVAGVRLGDRVVLFHRDKNPARSVFYFDTEEGPGALKYFLAGLAPGPWDIWWKGYLETPDVLVEPRHGALYFEGPPGGYYLRRRA